MDLSTERQDLEVTEAYLREFEEHVRWCHTEGKAARENGSPQLLNAVYGKCVDAEMSMPANYVSSLFHKYEALTELCDYERDALERDYVEAVRNKDDSAHSTQDLARIAAKRETHACRMHCSKVKYLAVWAKTLVQRLHTVQIQVSHFRTNQN